MNQTLKKSFRRVQKLLFHTLLINFFVNIQGIPYKLLTEPLRLGLYQKVLFFYLLLIIIVLIQFSILYKKDWNKSSLLKIVNYNSKVTFYEIS